MVEMQQFLDNLFLTVCCKDFNNEKSYYALRGKFII